jgi:hypothetical protein
MPIEGIFRSHEFGQKSGPQGEAIRKLYCFVLIKFRLFFLFYKKIKYVSRQGIGQIRRRSYRKLT